MKKTRRGLVKPIVEKAVVEKMVAEGEIYRATHYSQSGTQEVFDIKS